jgi:hypothetical protein
MYPEQKQKKYQPRSHVNFVPQTYESGRRPSFLGANVQRTYVFNIFYHGEAAMGKGLKVDVGEFKCSNQERAGVCTQELVMTRTNDHS